jgi:hypothetical protein
MKGSRQEMDDTLWGSDPGPAAGGCYASPGDTEHTGRVMRRDRPWRDRKDGSGTD